MKFKLTLSGLSLLMLMLITLPTQADFIQCAGGGPQCDGTVNDDIINGTPIDDNVEGGAGNDIIFGGDGPDDLNGLTGNDVIFGGPGDDEIEDGGGNDIHLPGPDVDQNSGQLASGGSGNDATLIFAGEIAGCILIENDNGIDVVNLIGMGPYSAQMPFGQPGFGGGYVLVIDPITGGQIFINVFENNDEGTETIHGLPSPNVTIVDFGVLEPTNCSQFT